MSLKSKNGIIESEPSNYERNSHPAGINFELKDGTALFAPYSFLSHALYQSSEITIHYSFGIVRIKGDRLKGVYTLLQTNELSSIICTNDKTGRPDEPRINEILFESLDSLVN